jgi:hypothetical protein
MAYDTKNPDQTLTKIIISDLQWVAANSFF